MEYLGPRCRHRSGFSPANFTTFVHFSDYVDSQRPRRKPHTEKLHVIERWRMVDERKFMEVTLTVEDPDTYYEPWSGMRSYRRVARQFDEEI